MAINASFERSLEFWSSLQERGDLDTSSFLHQAAHISAVWTPENIAFLRQRFSQLKDYRPLRGCAGAKTRPSSPNGCLW